MIFMIREKFRWKTILSGLLITLLPFLVLVGGWQWRNLEVAGVFRLTSVQGWALYQGKGAQIYSEKHQVPLLEAQNILWEKLDQTHPGWRRIPMEQLDDIYLAEGWKLMRENPGLTVKTHVLQMFYFFFAPGTTSAFFRIFDPDFEMIRFDWFQKGEYFRDVFNNHKQFLLWMLIGASYLGVLYFWLMAWVVPNWRGRKELRWQGTHVLFLLLVLYIAAVSGVNYGQDRYRVVVMPLLCMYAGAGYPGFLNYLKTLKGWTEKDE
jgi:hypothetical protein